MRPFPDSVDEVTTVSSETHWWSQWHTKTGEKASGNMNKVSGIGVPAILCIESGDRLAKFP